MRWETSTETKAAAMTKRRSPRERREVKVPQAVPVLRGRRGQMEKSANSSESGVGKVP